MNAPHHDKLNRQTPPHDARQDGSSHPIAEIDLRLEWRDEGIFFRLSLYGRIVQAGCLTGAKHLLGLSLLNLAVADYHHTPSDLLADPRVRPNPSMKTPHHDSPNRRAPPSGACRDGSVHSSAEIELQVKWLDDGMFFRLFLHDRIVQAGRFTGTKELLGRSLLNLAVADYHHAPRDPLADPLLRPGPRDDGGRDDFGPDDGAGHA